MENDPYFLQHLPAAQQRSRPNRHRAVWLRWLGLGVIGLERFFSVTRSFVTPPKTAMPKTSATTRATYPPAALRRLECTTRSRHRY